MAADGPRCMVGAQGKGMPPERLKTLFVNAAAEAATGAVAGAEAKGDGTAPTGSALPSPSMDFEEFLTWLWLICKEHFGQCDATERQPAPVHG